MDKVALLRHAVESEVKGEPVDKALADGLVEHFGLEAEQYLGEHPDGPYSDAEVMALGLYTNGEYQHLNRSPASGARAGCWPGVDRPGHVCRVRKERTG